MLSLKLEGEVDVDWISPLAWRPLSLLFPDSIIFSHTRKAVRDKGPGKLLVCTGGTGGEYRELT